MGHKLIGYHVCERAVDRFGDDPGGFSHGPRGWGIYVSASVHGARPRHTRAPEGHLHTVGLLAAGDRYLQWDAALEAQSPYVKRVVASILDMPLANEIFGRLECGGDLYHTLEDIGFVMDAPAGGRGQAGVSRYLASFGIAGLSHEYQGEVNHVIFDPATIEVLEIDGVAVGATPEHLLQALERQGVSVLLTAPTADLAKRWEVSDRSLREELPRLRKAIAQSTAMDAADEVAFAVLEEASGTVAEDDDAVYDAVEPGPSPI